MHPDRQRFSSQFQTLQGSGKIAFEIPGKGLLIEISGLQDRWLDFSFFPMTS